MTYAKLLQEISKYEDFDSNYSIAHLTVDECFDGMEAYGKSWNEKADKESLKELEKYL